MKKSIYVPNNDLYVYLETSDIETLFVRQKKDKMEDKIEFDVVINLKDTIIILETYSNKDLAVSEINNIDIFLLDENTKHYIMTEEDK